MTVAITAASGQLGRLAIENLKTRIGAEKIVALVRSPEKAADLGVEVRAFDFTKPENQVSRLEGIETLVLISIGPSPERVKWHTNVIHSAKTAGVKRIIYTSMLKCDISPISIMPDHKNTEAAIVASGLAYTLLRNPWYFEIWTRTLGAAIEAGALISTIGDGKVTPAARHDLAEAIASVAAGDGHENQIYELGGDEAFTFADFAAELSRQIGKDIPYKNLSQAAYEEVLNASGMPALHAKIIADAEHNAGQGWLFDGSKTLSRLIGRPTTSLKQAVAAALA
ncbi:SDR family oxidoreductase [Marinomonas transparens]|uniref:SDR family oxidoreductase n=1 Tax=Marinomonas transparens TaxID=2795388 RepID=A0A934MZW0_9GAMM|nr:SDR family oxidoreductase [Marinomonas transparens]MBJ7536092.1 SDR family oxidoreductase [Marinomonas transparens]